MHAWNFNVFRWATRTILAFEPTKKRDMLQKWASHACNMLMYSGLGFLNILTTAKGRDIQHDVRLNMINTNNQEFLRTMKLKRGKVHSTQLMQGGKKIGLLSTLINLGDIIYIREFFFFLISIVSNRDLTNCLLILNLFWMNSVDF